MATSLRLSQGFSRGWELILTIVDRGTIDFVTSLSRSNAMSLTLSPYLQE